MPMMRPLAHWPVSWHIGLALLVMAMVGGVSWRVWEGQKTQIDLLTSALVAERLAVSLLSKQGDTQ